MDDLITWSSGQPCEVTSIIFCPFSLVRIACKMDLNKIQICESLRECLYSRWSPPTRWIVQFMEILAHSFPPLSLHPSVPKSMSTNALTSWSDPQQERTVLKRTENISKMQLFWHSSCIHIGNQSPGNFKWQSLCLLLWADCPLTNIDLCIVPLLLMGQGKLKRNTGSRYYWSF